MRLGRVNSITEWKSTNNYKDFAKHYQKIRFGQIKLGLAKRSIRHGKFGIRRPEKLMDELLKEITKLKPVKSDSTSLSRYATTILGFVNNMDQNGCPVTNAKEAPFVMSQCLSKLDTKDNIEFGREMHSIEKQENVLSLLD